MKQLTMKEIQKESCKTAREHGFHDPFYIPEKLCLIHSEISEAMEDYRSDLMKTYRSTDGKPCGFPSELADAVIRIADMAEYLGIDLNKEIQQKMDYNNGRPYKHGRKC